MTTVRAVPRSLMACMVLIGAVILAYIRVWHFTWAWDDYLLFVDTPQLRDGTISWTALTQPILPNTAYFRPLTLLSFALEFKYFGLGAGLAHGVNLGIFLLNTLLVFTISRRLFRNDDRTSSILRPGIAALVYGLHPAMTESVAWISGRFDLLCTSFALLAALLALLPIREYLRAAAVALAFLCALLNKEMAVTLPLLIAFLLIARDLEHERRTLRQTIGNLFRTRWPTAGGVLLSLLAWLALRQALMGKLLHVDVNLIARLDDTPERIILVLRSIAFYISAAFVPFAHLSPHHAIDFDDLTSLGSLGICVCVLMATMVILLGALRGRAIAWLFLATLCSLLPVCQIIPLTIAGGIGAERFLALPMAFMVFAVFSIEPMPLPSIRRSAQVFSAQLFIAGWLVLAGACLYVTVPLWRNDMTLWTWTYRQHPESRVVRQSYITAALRERAFDIAGPILESIREHEGFTPVMQLIYGNYLIETDKADEGVLYLQGSLAVFPRPDLDPDVQLDASYYRYAGYGFSSLALGLLTQRKYAEALDAARISLWYRPYSGTSEYWTSLALYGLGKPQEAEAAFQQAKSWYPEGERDSIQEQRDLFLKHLEKLSADKSS